MKTAGNLATVGRYGAVWEAEMVRDRLEAAGIQAFVQGSETGRSLSYIGVALGGVRVQVAEQDMEAARHVLAEDEHQRATAGDWRCPRCDEPNDASFDLCWSCSLPRSAASGDPQEKRLAAPQLPTVDEPVEVDQDGDPYRPPQLGGVFDENETRRGGLISLLFVAVLIAAAAMVLLSGGAP